MLAPSSGNPSRKRPVGTGGSIAGVFAGALLGFIIEPLVFWSAPPEHGIRLPWIGPSIGTASGLLLAMTVGAVALRGWAKHLIIGGIVGSLIGLFVGATIYPQVMTARDPFGKVVPTKVFPAYQAYGITRGVPLGTIIGATLAVWGSFCFRCFQSRSLGHRSFFPLIVLNLHVVGTTSIASDPSRFATHPANIWVKRTPLSDTPVSPRLGHEGACVWDRRQQLLVRYGGHNQGGGGEQGAEVWTFDLATAKWTLQEPNTSPPAVADAAIGFVLL